MIDFATMSALPEDDALRRFVAWATDAGPDASPAMGALLVALDHDPETAIEDAMARLDELAEACRPGLGTLADLQPAQVADRLYGDHGFHGNRRAYHDPRNSFLHDVLARRTGIPITLAIVFLEVAHRLGLDAHGINFPGHFLVGWSAGDRRGLMDPFDGSTLDEGSCRRRLESVFGPEVTFGPHLLRPAGTDEILARLNRNLKRIHVEARDFSAALRCAHRILALQPDNAVEVRDRGLLWHQLECSGEAVADLERFLVLTPDDPSAGRVRRAIDQIRSGATSVN